MSVQTTTALRVSAALLFGCAFALPAHAGISADQIARLDGDLTPLGGERAGNAEGTIPAWTGGITAPPAGYAIGDHHRDPFADDSPLFVIDADTLDAHRDRVSVGLQRMIELYPSFHMTVYPTRRSASAPERVYDATRAVAATAAVVDDGNGVSGAAIGIPFPIPANGQEAIWNHLLRYRGETVNCEIGQAAVTRGGAYTLVKLDLDVEFRYALPGMTPEALGNIMIYFKQKVVAPARLAGDILLVHETINQVREPRSAWAYNPGQRRVRRAPDVSLRQSRNLVGRAAHRRPVRHVQRRHRPLRLEPCREARTLRSLQRLQAAQRRAFVRRHPYAAARQSGTSAL